MNAKDLLQGRRFKGNENLMNLISGSVAKASDWASDGLDFEDFATLEHVRRSRTKSEKEVWEDWISE